MKSLIGPIVVILAIFFGILFLLGSQFGAIEITVWFAALVAALTFTVRRQRRVARREQNIHG
ncbi:hypothetical protein AQJ43_14960 [Streptomyces avermitilis]|uniref:Uncharacterized protein n=1 Tax=Streptomyces avermitilis TaxID=33903 RepID=A0A4D4M2J4_STRAX|nr:MULTISPECIES: hypothetical protein [Streptomyces]KUN54606.1 hypothetical protein AQJ43_14960 [Streptomyces avermitilis]MYT01385.1 hypothetical protein [Streptomyces sp. SID5469]OOV30973.1 hypothetical protein SM007_17590 [Streptomyces avermitilis]BBJ54008.1 hypothetical protein SAVMC3_66370 [Streptomyces avermitilis]GDY66019.1 hypothetical protein SAV14893_054120 [Streptomyces avermitilis]